MLLTCPRARSRGLHVDGAGGLEITASVGWPSIRRRRHDGGAPDDGGSVVAAAKAAARTGRTRRLPANKPLSLRDQTERVSILVVDDEKAVRESLDRALRLEGYRVRLAADGREALENVASDEPDAIVLDLMMPNVDGSRCAGRFAPAAIAPRSSSSPRAAVADRVEGLDPGPRLHSQALRPGGAAGEASRAPAPSGTATGEKLEFADLVPIRSLRV